MRLLIIDDEENMCHMLESMVKRHGYQVHTALDGAAGLELLRRQRFDFVLCDVRMPGLDGMAFLEQGRELLGETTVIMMSAYGSIETALEAMKAGAYDFISKPFKTDEVLLTLKKAEEREALKAENRRLKEELRELAGAGGFGSMIGESASMREVFQLGARVAQYDTTVLITGESGTGKELVARGIHRLSARRNRSLVTVNCGSIPANLIESELFGHVRGAFTGAHDTKKGLFEQADGSTLFLDEIGELPLELQVRLLRVIQEGEIKPVGSAVSKQVDVRVLAATARDLAARVRDNLFREDLYYRLNVMPIELPPLRERREDIPLLIQFFIKKFNKQLEVRVKGFSTEAMAVLCRYDWPGNVRELENVVQRCLVVCTGKVVALQELPDTVLKKSRPLEKNRTGGLSIKQGQRRMERELILQALARTEGNKSKAALLLEISYPSLLSKIKEYGID